MDILADYREWRTQQAGRVSTHSDGCHMWHRDCMIHRLAAEVERLRLVICDKISELGEEMQGTPAEPSTPSEGTRQGDGTSEPVAWVAFADDASESGVPVLHRDEADEIAARHGWSVAPLYRSPTLTDAERFVLREVCAAYADRDDVAANEIAAVIDGLLERTR